MAEAKVGLNEIAEILNELAVDAYRLGYDDGAGALNDRENEAAERQDRFRFQEFEPEE